jgi:hypothetical protein
MSRFGGRVSLALAVVAAAELSYNPAGHAQAAPQPSEPEVQVQGGNVAPPPAPAAEPPRGAVTAPSVTLRSNSPRARLQIQTQLRWQDVCVTPCNVAVNPVGTYRVGGGSIRPSESFQLPRTSGQIVIDTQVGSNIKHWVGVGMIILGIADLVAGAIFYATAADWSAASADPSVTSEAYFQVVGIGSIVTGIVLLAIGIPLSTSRTSVTVR